MQPGQSLGFRLSISTENRAKLRPGNSILNTPIWMSFKMSEALIRRKFSSTRFVGQKNLDRDRSGRHHKKKTQAAVEAVLVHIPEAREKRHLLQIVCQWASMKSTRRCDSGRGKPAAECSNQPTARVC